MLDQIQELLLSPVGAMTIVVLTVVILLTKRYFGGARCTVDQDLSGKVVVITGGNAGIGRVTMEQLANRNCTVIFGARREKQS